jgi:uncharacterized membrane protein YgcG
MPTLHNADRMKSLFFIFALISLCLSAACSRTQQTPQRVNFDNGHIGSTAGTGSTNANNAAVERAANTNQTDEAESLLLPQPEGYVNDFARVLDAQTKAHLAELVRKLKERSDIEFAIVTVKTTGKQSVDDYSLTLARSWGVGSKPRGDGLLLLLATDDRQWRIQVSRSLEADLPNDVVGELGGLMNEPFRQRNYGEGLTRCVEALITRLGERRGFEIN